MDKIEVLRNQYYEAILNLQDEEDIRSALPQPEYQSFFQVIYGLITKLESNVQELQEELQKSSDNDVEMLEYIKEELAISMMKKNLCAKLIDDAKEVTTEETKAETGNKKKLIFATTPMGNVYFEEDLKNIPEEYYADIIESLQSLKSGFTESNEEKGKSLNNNAKLKGVHEIKPFKVRIGYINLSPDLTYIILVKMKKSNNDSKDRADLINRNSRVTPGFQSIRELIKDENQKSMLVQQNQKIEERLIEYLNSNKRGQK